MPATYMLLIVCLIVALVLTTHLLEAVEDLHMLDRTREEIPILEKERDNLLRAWG